MFRNHAIRRNFVLIIAFAIVWVFLGALLNFHANRILGTQLIDQAYPAIKPKTKENTFHFSDLSKKSVYFDLFISSHTDLSKDLQPSALERKQELVSDIIEMPESYHFGLRAPPTV